MPVWLRVLEAGKSERMALVKELGLVKDGSSGRQKGKRNRKRAKYTFMPVDSRNKYNLVNNTGQFRKTKPMRNEASPHMKATPTHEGHAPHMKTTPTYEGHAHM